MKNIVLIFLLLMPVILKAQKDISSPKKNDNVIVVTTDTLDRKAIEKVASTLIDQGFTIREKNPEKGTITTDPYDYERGRLTIYVQLSLNEIRIYGMCEPNLAVISGANKPRQLTKKVYFGEAEGSSVKRAWNVMDAFANQLSQVLRASVTYLKW